MSLHHKDQSILFTEIKAPLIQKIHKNMQEKYTQLFNIKKGGTHTYHCALSVKTTGTYGV
jgi:hypothetical protein